ncbi:hypothetical protein KAX35_02195 [candidate division WOR-3 bacterium]|nr:hypothetical protein [candidate division WOR-3 bacterium]
MRLPRSFHSLAMTDERDEIATLTAFARNDNFFHVIARRPSYFLTDNEAIAFKGR